MLPDNDDIVAIATPPGRGGISIVRLSGPGIAAFAQSFLGRLPTPRSAILTDFKELDGTVIDSGIALYFSAPESYTGEHVLELQGHGSPVVMQMLLRRCQASGIRLARPGEFSERAFLNGRMNLAQAEAVADLIESSTESAARSAMRSLKGAFSEQIESLVSELIDLRIYVESAMDFPDEEIDFLGEEAVVSRLNALAERFSALNRSAQQGRLLKEGLSVVLTGLPNAGKSRLLNRLSNENRAIVSATPGTTRDVLEQYIEIDGLPVKLFDTAGLRDSVDEIEAEGVRRARCAQAQADLIVLVIDVTDSTEGDVRAMLPDSVPMIKAYNKIDLTGESPEETAEGIYLSALTGQGIDCLLRAIKRAAGYRQSDDSQFMARERHMHAIRRAEGFLLSGIRQLADYRAGELLAEELAECQRALGEITGELTSDDLLGLIFGSFCIGK